jgi:enoyl-CoA hydratase/carnithine racemase
MLSLITGATDYDGFGDVDFVIEAAPERMEIKQVVFSELHEVTPGDIDAGIEAEKHAFATVFASEDARDGISAFLHKRPLRFQGK